MRRFCLRRLGVTFISLRQFYKLADTLEVPPCSAAATVGSSDVCQLPFARADPILNLDCNVGFAQARQILTIDQAIAVGNDSPSAIVELAAAQQPFYDIRIIQPMQYRAPVCILVQCKWSADPATRDGDLAPWLGTMQRSTRSILPHPPIHFGQLCVYHYHYRHYFVCSTVTEKAKSLAHQDNAVFVYVAARHLPTPRHFVQPHRNVIVLDNDALMYLYGPTLRGSYQFLLRLSEADISSVAASLEHIGSGRSSTSVAHDSW